MLLSVGPGLIAALPRWPRDDAHMHSLPSLGDNSRPGTSSLDARLGCSWALRGNRLRLLVARSRPVLSCRLAHLPISPIGTRMTFSITNDTAFSTSVIGYFSQEISSSFFEDWR